MKHYYIFLSLLLAVAINAMNNLTLNKLDNLPELNEKGKKRIEILLNHINPICQEKEEGSSELTENFCYNQEQTSIDFEKELIQISREASFKHYINTTHLFNLINKMDLKDILAISSDCWCSLMWEYVDIIDRTHNKLYDKNPCNELFTALANRIKYSEISSANIDLIHPFILRAKLLIAQQQKDTGCFKHIVSCITLKNVARCDDQSLEILHNNHSFKEKFLEFIIENGICGVPHFMVKCAYNSDLGKLLITQKIKKSIESEKRSLVEYFVVSPRHALRWIQNIKLLENSEEIFKKFNISQSSQHFIACITLVAEDMSYYLNDSKEFRIHLLKVLQIAEEEEKKGNIIFVHAQKKSWGYLQDCFKELWNIYYSDKEPVRDDYWFFRYNLPGDNLPFERINEVMEHTNYVSGYDHETLYMNYGPFSSTSSLGSSTTKYAKNNHDYASITFPVRQLFETFKWERYYDKYSNEFKELENLFQKSSGKYGTIHVISFTPEEAKKLVCTAEGFGRRAPKKINNKETNDVVEITTALKENPHSIEDPDKVEFFTILTDGKKDALLEENGEGFLNPYNKRVRIYSVRSDNSGKLKEYCEKSKLLFEKINNDIKNDKEDNGNQQISNVSSSLTIQSLGFDRDSASKYKTYCQDCKSFKKYNDSIQAHNTSNTLRIMSYNVHYWLEGTKQIGLYTSNLEDILHSIKKLNPDVVCLQEVSLKKGLFNPYEAQALIQKFREMGYTYGGEDTFGCCINTEDDIFGNITFSKYPLENIVKKEYAFPDETHQERRTFVGTTIAYNNQQIRIYNTHLDVHDTSGKTRQLEVEELLLHIEKEDYDMDNVIIMGDFNETRKRDYQYKINDILAWDLIQQDDKKRNFPTPTYVEDTFEKAGYKDAYELCQKRPILTSWTGKIIDFMYRKPGGTIDFQDVNAYYDKASDHTAIIVDIGVTENKENNNTKREKKKTIFDELSREMTKDDHLEDQTSSVLRIAEKGYQQTEQDKLRRYENDCIRFKLFNERIQKHDPKTTCRVMNWNVNDWKNLKGESNINEIFEVIKTVNPDIVCLHNAYFGKTENGTWIPYYDIKALKYNTDELSKKFQELGFGPKKTKNQARHGGPKTFGYNRKLETNSGDVPCGTIMYSKYTLKDIVSDFYSVPKVTITSTQRNAFVGASILFNKKPVYIYCTRLDPQTDKECDTNNRTKQSQELIEHIEKNKIENVFICGDFYEPYKPQYTESQWNAIVREDKKRGIITKTDGLSNFEKAGYKNALKLCNIRIPFTNTDGTVTSHGLIKSTQSKNGTITITNVQPLFTTVSNNLPIIFDLTYKQ